MDAEKSIEFLLNQQSATSARVERRSANVDQLTTTVRLFVEKTDEQMDRLTNVVRNLAERTAQGFAQTAEGFARMQDAHARLEDAQRQTESNLNALIKVADDFIRRDGRQQPPQ